MNNNQKGALLIILAGTCWGVISIFINYLSDAGLGTMQISFIRQMISVALFALIVLIRDPQKFRIRFRDLGLIMLCGLINGVMFIYPSERSKEAAKTSMPWVVIGSAVALGAVALSKSITAGF